MRALAFAVVLVGCRQGGGEPRELTPHAYVVHAAADAAARPDGELVIGVLGPSGVREDALAQLVAQVHQRRPDLIIAPREEATDEMLATVEHVTAAGVSPLSTSGLDYGFAHVAPVRGNVIVVSSQRSRGPVELDLEALRRDNRAAIVRVKRDTITVQSFGTDGAVSSR